MRVLLSPRQRTIKTPKNWPGVPRLPLGQPNFDQSTSFQDQLNVWNRWCLRGVPKLGKRPDVYKSPEAEQSPAGDVTTKSSLRKFSKRSVNRSSKSLTISSIGRIRSRISLPSRTRVTLSILRIVL